MTLVLAFVVVVGVVGVDVLFLSHPESIVFFFPPVDRIDSAVKCESCFFGSFLVRPPARFQPILPKFLYGYF